MQIKISKEKQASFAVYAEKHNIYGLFEDLTKQLLIKKPLDPVDFILAKLRNEKGMSPCVHIKQQLNDSSKHNCSRSSIIWKDATGM